MTKTEIKNKKIILNKQINISVKHDCSEKLCSYCLLYCKKRINILNVYPTVGHVRISLSKENVLYNN